MFIAIGGPKCYRPMYQGRGVARNAIKARPVLRTAGTSEHSWREPRSGDANHMQAQRLRVAKCTNEDDGESNCPTTRQLEQMPCSLIRGRSGWRMASCDVESASAAAQQHSSTRVTSHRRNVEDKRTCRAFHIRSTSIACADFSVSSVRMECQY